jgi:hypothetical protein
MQSIFDFQYLWVIYTLALFMRHDSQHNDIRQADILHNGLDCDTQLNNTLHNVMLSCTFFCCNAEYIHTVAHYLSAIMLDILWLSVVMLYINMLCIIMLSS